METPCVKKSLAVLGLREPLLDHRVDAVADRLLERAEIDAERRSTTFEEQISTLYTNLSKVHERAEDWAAAANALSLIPIDTGVRTVPGTPRCTAALHRRRRRVFA